MSSVPESTNSRMPLLESHSKGVMVALNTLLESRTGQQLAANGKVPPEIGVGVPFFLFTGFCVWMFLGSRKRPGDTPIGHFVERVGDVIERIQKRLKPRRRMAA